MTTNLEKLFKNRKDDNSFLYTIKELHSENLRDPKVPDITVSGQIITLRFDNPEAP
jgi:hypothetical protein